MIQVVTIIHSTKRTKLNNKITKYTFMATLTRQGRTLTDNYETHPEQMYK